MKELRQKQAVKGWLYSIPALIALVVLAFLLARGAASIVGKEKESAATLESLRKNNVALKARQESLKEDIAKLQTEEGRIEEIRRKYNVTLPGEHLAIVVADAPVESATTSPWYLKMWNAIIKKHE